jgi:hypothetical protein
MAGNPVASINAQLGLDSTQFSAGLGQARTQMTLFGKQMSGVQATLANGLVRSAEEFGGALRGMATGLPGIGSALGAMGVAGIAAGAGIAAAAGAFALLLNKGREALQFADGIHRVAVAAEVSATTLQQYRYAVHAVGGAYEDADAALIAFQGNLGAAASGASPKLAKVFKQLLLDPVALVNKDLDGALRDVAEKFAAMPTAAIRIGYAQKLGLMPLLPLLEEGAAGMDRLRAAAMKLGVVMDESLVTKAAEANKKVEDLSLVFKVQLNSIMAEAAPLILGVATAFAQAAKSANGFFQTLQQGRIRELKAHLAEVDNQIAVNLGALDLGPVAEAQAAMGRAMHGGQAGYQKHLLKTHRTIQGSIGDPPAGAPAAIKHKPYIPAPSDDKAAKRPSRTVDQINDELALEVARAKGDAAEEERLRRQLELRKRIREYEDAGIKPAAAQLAAKQAMATLEKAQDQARDQELFKLQRAAELEAARAAGNEDRVHALEEETDLESRIAAYEGKKFAYAAALTQAEADRKVIKEGQAAGQAKALADMKLELDIQLAQIRGDVVLEASLVRQKDLQALIAKYQGQKLDLVQAELQAQRDMAAIDKARADAAAKWNAADARDQRIAIGDAKGDPARADVRQKAIDEKADQLQASHEGMDRKTAVLKATIDVDALDTAHLQGRVRDTFRDGFRAAFDGNFGSWMESWWKDRLSNAMSKAFDGLADLLGDVLSGAFRNGAGGGGGIMGAAGSVIGSFFGAHDRGGSFIVGGAGGMDGNLATMKLSRGERVDITRPDQQRADAGVQVHMPITLNAQGAGPREVDVLMTRLNQLEAGLPGQIMSTVQGGFSRGALSTRRG